MANYIIIGQSADELLKLPPDLERLLTEEEILHILKTFGCIWKHSGDFSKPHASLPGGSCTNYFINTPIVLEVVNINQLLASQLSFKIWEAYPGMLNKNIRVVNASYASTALATNVARIIKAKRHTSLKKSHEGNGLVWPADITFMSQDEEALACDEIVASTSTGTEILEVITKENPGCRLAPIFPILINRSGKEDICGLPIVSVINIDPAEFNIWPTSSCPLCNQGSQTIRIRSGDKKAWQKLISA